MSEFSKQTRNQIIFFLIVMATVGLSLWLWIRTLSALALNPIPFRFFEMQVNGERRDGESALFCYGSAFIEADDVWRTCTRNTGQDNPTINITRFQLNEGVANVIWEIGQGDLQYLTAFVKQSDSDYLFVVGDYALQTVYRASLDGFLTDLYQLENQRLIGLHQAGDVTELVSVQAESNPYQLNIISLGDNVEISSLELLDCDLAQDCALDYAEYHDGSWHFMGNRPADVPAGEPLALEILELHDTAPPEVIQTLPAIENVHYSLEDDGILWTADLLDISAGNVANLYETARPFRLVDDVWQVAELPQNQLNDEQIESLDFINHYRLLDDGGIKVLPSLGININLHYYYVERLWLKFDNLALSIPEVSDATLRYQDVRVNSPRHAVAYTTSAGDFAYLRDGDSYIRFDEHMRPSNGLNLSERVIRAFNTSEGRDIPAQFYRGEGALIKQLSMPILLLFLPLAYLVWGFVIYPSLLRQQALDMTRSRFDVKYLAIVGLAYFVLFMLFIPYFDGIMTFL